MILSKPVKKITVTFLLIALTASLFVISGCKKKRPEIAEFFFKQTHNKVYQDFTPEGYGKVFKKMLQSQRGDLRFYDFINAHYSKNNYQPDFVVEHLFNGDMADMVSYYLKAEEHGLNKTLFEPAKLRDLILKFQRKNNKKTLDEAYQELAQIELTSVNSLVNYSNALQFGLINPKHIYQRYFIVTKRPDGGFMEHIYNIDNMNAYLDSIQPKAQPYLAIQKALAANYTAPGRSLVETRRMLAINLERLRWRNKPFEPKYVIVNIPDFNLNVVDSGHSVLKMKVCVGQGRNMTNENTLAAYNDTCKADQPNEHETPLLNSLIHSVDVNPVWNIPRSIANKEILVEAADDKFYLANKGIDVYQNGKLVDNPEDIDWTKVTKDNSDYDFKQKPGVDNSLGKIKFLFKNKSSVYLHDTPAKRPFTRSMRAVSHGCVRLGDPQALALNLFGAGDKFDEIAKDMAEDNPDPTTIYLPKKIPVYITYITCWPDENGELQFRNDVYGHDIVLYDHMKKYLAPFLN